MTSPFVEGPITLPLEYVWKAVSAD